MHHPISQLPGYMGTSDRYHFEQIDKRLAEAMANGLRKPWEYKQRLLAYKYFNLESEIHTEYPSKQTYFTSISLVFLPMSYATCSRFQ